LRKYSRVKRGYVAVSLAATDSGSDPLLSDVPSGRISPSLTSHAGARRSRNSRKRERLIRPTGTTRVLTRAGAIGESGSIGMATSGKCRELVDDHHRPYMYCSGGSSIGEKKLQGCTTPGLVTDDLTARVTLVKILG
jgi:hypothetical protein